MLTWWLILKFTIHSVDKCDIKCQFTFLSYNNIVNHYYVPRNTSAFSFWKIRPSSLSHSITETFYFVCFLADYLRQHNPASSPTSSQTMNPQIQQVWYTVLELYFIILKFVVYLNSVIEILGKFSSMKIQKEGFQFMICSTCYCSVISLLVARWTTSRLLGWIPGIRHIIFGLFAPVLFCYQWTSIA